MNNYIKYADVLKQFEQNKIAIKTQIFKGDQIASSKKREAYGILIKCQQYYEQIIEILKDLSQKQDVHISNQYLFCVLVVERFLSKKQKINGGGKIKKTIENNEQFIRTMLKLTDKDPQQTTACQTLIKQKIYIKLFESRMKIPKFVQIYDIQTENYIVDQDISGLIQISYEQYQHIILQKPEFISDIQFIIQSKSSALPAYILSQNIDPSLKRFDIIDACAAPGNKTMQLAEYLQILKKGKLFAFEKSQERFKILEERIKQYKFDEIVNCFHQNFLDLDEKDKKFCRVKYILIDPTCSSSGMLSKINAYSATKKKTQLSEIKSSYRNFCQAQFSSLSIEEQKRIKSISDFQLKALKKAALFSPLYMSYSTCSIYEIENEQVVQKFLQSNRSYKLEKILPGWKERGFSTDYFPDGPFTIRVNPFNDYSTDGFFVALFKLVNKQP